MSSNRPDIVIFLPWDPSYLYEYEELIRAKHPDLNIRTVSTFAEAQAALPEAEIFMAFGLTLKPGFFAAARRLKWVHSFGAGLDGIVDDPSLAPDVVVTSTRGIHGPPLSELAIMLMLGLVREFPRMVRAQDRHEWFRFRTSCLHRKTVGILGVGLIAEALAPRLAALGMEVVGITRTARPLPGFHRFVPRDDLKAAVADLDFLVLLIPYEPETHQIINADVFGAMKPGAYVVNIARGGVVDEPALIAALESGHLGGAAIDAAAREPLPADDPLWDAPRLIITPHIGGFYDAYAPDSIDHITGNIALFREGRVSEMVNLAEPELIGGAGQVARLSAL